MAYMDCSERSSPIRDRGELHACGGRWMARAGRYTRTRGAAARLVIEQD
jgi:hypothetical protein